MPTRQKKLALLVLSLFSVSVLVLIYLAYTMIQGPNVDLREDTALLHISAGTELADLQNQLEDSAYLIRPKSFGLTASLMKFGDGNVKPGRYELHRGMSNRSLINLLRSGQQLPVNLVINNVRTLEDLAGKITQRLELDSATYLQHLLDPAVWEKLGKTHETMLTVFLPNTYRVYWNSSADQLTNRMRSEHDRFWSRNDRMHRCDSLGLSTEEVYTLASIVEKETQTKSERPTVAGLYLNRMAQNIPLAADPTVVYAVGDFQIQRVRHKHLEIDSPYNTYKFAGLPPGPIYMPSISSIDAVLFAEKHDYLYMCAKPGDSGKHAFASSISGHARNANAYRRWLDQQGIY